MICGHARRDRLRRCGTAARWRLSSAGPLTLGFLGLAAATFVRAGLELGWVEPAEGKKAALIAIAFTVALQFAASVIGFLARDGVAATGMGLLAGIWLAFALVTYTSPPGSTSDALGLFLVVAAVAICIPAASVAALDGVIYDQVAQLQKEPGVRLQL